MSFIQIEGSYPPYTRYLFLCIKRILNSHIVDGYMAFLENLSPGAKLDIISKLTQSLKSDVQPKENRFERSFGARVDRETAEEIIQDIRNSKTFNRHYVEPSQ